MDRETDVDARPSRLRTAAVGAGLGIAAVVGIGAATSALAGAQDDAPPVETQADDAPGDGQWLHDALAPLVEDETLTQEQADAVVERLREARPDRPFDRPGFDHRGEGSEAVADLLGMTTDELRDALRNGSTLADLASDAGVSTDDLVDAMLAGVKAHLAERVADGSITQEQADARLAEAEQRATAVANGERPERPGRFGHHDDDSSSEGSTEDSSA